MLGGFWGPQKAKADHRSRGARESLEVRVADLHRGLGLVAGRGGWRRHSGALGLLLVVLGLLSHVASANVIAPLAIAKLMRIVSMDSNVEEGLLSVTVAFGRDFEYNEFPGGLGGGDIQDVEGYRLYLVHTDAAVAAAEGVERVLVTSRTISDLDSPSGSTRNHFVVDGLAYYRGDAFQIFSYNSGGECASGSQLLDVVDVMFPDAVARNMTQSLDVNLLPNTANHEVGFVRGTAESEVNDRVLGYRLYISEPGVTGGRLLVQEKTLHELGGSPGCVVEEVVLSTRNFGEEISWQVRELDGTLVCESQQAYESNTVYEGQPCCLVAGEYTLSCNDDFRDGWHGATIQIGSHIGSYIGTFCGDYVQPAEWPHKTKGQHNVSISVGQCVVRQVQMRTASKGYEATWEILNDKNETMCASVGHRQIARELGEDSGLLGYRSNRDTLYVDDTLHDPESCCLPVGDYKLRCINAYTSVGEGEGWPRQRQPEDYVDLGDDRTGGWHGGSLQILTAVGTENFYDAMCGDFVAGGVMVVPFHVGHEPGGEVANPFLVNNVEYPLPYSSYEIRSFNEDLESDHAVRQLVEDVGVPAFVPDDTNITRDLELQVDLYSSSITFARLNASSELPNSTGDVIGYALVVTDLDEAGGGSPRVVDNVTVEQLEKAGAASATLTAEGVSVGRGRNVTVGLHTYSKDGLSLDSVQLPVIDLALPIANATGASLAADTNLEAGKVTYYVNFTRDDAANEKPGDARDASGYGLYLRSSSGLLERVATVPLVFAGAFSRLTVYNLTVSQGDTLEVASYTDGGVALHASVAGGVSDKASPVGVATNLVLHGSDSNLDDDVVTIELSFDRMSSTEEAADAVTGYAVFIDTDGSGRRHVDVPVNDHNDVVRSVSVVLSDVELFRDTETVYVLAFNIDGLSLKSSEHVDIGSKDLAVPVSVATRIAASADRNPASDVVTQFITFHRDLVHDARDQDSDPDGYYLFQVKPDGSNQTVGTLTMAELFADGDAIVGNFTVSDLGVEPGDAYGVHAFNSNGLSWSHSTLLPIIDVGIPDAVATSLSVDTDSNPDERFVTATVSFVRASQVDEEGLSGTETLGYVLCLETSWGATEELVHMTLAELSGSAGGAVGNGFALVDQPVKVGDSLVVYSYNAAGRSATGSVAVAVDTFNVGLPRAVAQDVIQSVDTDPALEAIACQVSFTRGDSLAESHPQIDGYKLYIVGSGGTGQERLVGSMTLAELGGSSGSVATTPFNVVASSIAAGDVFRIHSYIDGVDDVSLVGSNVIDVIDVSEPQDTATGIEVTDDTDLQRGYMSLVINFTHSTASGNTVPTRGYRLWVDSTETNHAVTLEEIDAADGTGRFVLAHEHVGLSASVFFVRAYNDHLNASEVSSSQTGLVDAFLPEDAIATSVAATQDENATLNVVTCTVSFTRASSATEADQLVESYALYRAASTQQQHLVDSMTLAELGGSGGAAVANGFELNNIVVAPQETWVVRAVNRFGTADGGSALDDAPTGDIATPTAVVSSVVASDDESNVTFGVVTQDVSCLRPPATDESPATVTALAVSGYRLYVRRGSEDNAKVEQLISDVSVSSLRASNATHVTFRVEDLSGLVHGDEYVVRSYNALGDSALEATALVFDHALPHASPLSVTQSADEAGIYGRLTAPVSFVRSAEEWTGLPQAVTSYQLRLLDASGEERSYSVTKTLEELGGVPGGEVSSPFLVTDLAVFEGDVLSVRTINAFGPSGNATNATVADLGVPLITVDVVAVGNDTYRGRHAVTHNVTFAANTTSGLSTADNIVGYTLFACPAAPAWSRGAGHAADECYSVIDVSANELGSAESWTFDLVEVNVENGDGVYAVVPFNAVGHSHDVGATVKVSDRAQPLAVLAEPVTLTPDTNGLDNIVRFNVSFIRPAEGEENPNRAAHTMGYKLFRASADGSRVEELWSASLDEAGPSPVVPIHDLLIDAGDTLRVYAYNQHFVSDDGSPARIMSDLVAPSGVASNLIQSVDEHMGLKTFTGTISFERPADEGNITYAETQHGTETRGDYESIEEFRRDAEAQLAGTTLGYILYVYDTADAANLTTSMAQCTNDGCDAGPALVEVMRMTLDELGGAPGERVDNPFTLTGHEYEYTTRYCIRAYSRYFEGTSTSDAAAFVDIALPTAVATGLTATRDVDMRPRLLTSTISFVRADAATEAPGFPADTMGYALFLGRHGDRDEAAFRMIANMTLDELGGSPGQLVDSGFFLHHQVLAESDDIMIIRSWNIYGMNRFDAAVTDPAPSQWSELPFESIRADDLAVPISRASDLAYSVDSNILLHRVTSVVSFVRDVADKEFPDDGKGIARTEGYVLRHLDKDRVVKATYVKTVSDGLTSLTRATPGVAGSVTLGNRTIHEFGCAPGERVLDGFRVTDLDIEDGDMYDVVAYNQYGLALDSLYGLEHDYHAGGPNLTFSVPVGINDTVTPLAVATDLEHTSDWNTGRQRVTFWVYFKRADPAIETPGNAEDVVGYKLFLVSEGELDVLLDTLTLAELGNTSQGVLGLEDPVTMPGYVGVPFSVDGQVITDGDRLQVYSYNGYGLSAFGSEKILIVDRSIPVAQASQLAHSYDTNLNWTFVTQTISFTRAPPEQEQVWTTRHFSNSTFDYVAGDQQYLMEVRGYTLYVADLRGNKVELVGNMTVEELGGEPGGYVDQGFELVDLYIEDPNDAQFLVFAWNSVGEHDAASVGIRVEDNAVPVAVVPWVAPGADLNLLSNELLTTVYFDRPSAEEENPGTSEQVDGYKLFLQRDGFCAEGSCRGHSEESLVTSLTIDELDTMSTSGTTPRYLLQNITIHQHDNFVIYAYNEHGLSYNHSLRVSVGDEVVSVAVPQDAYHEDDTNSDENIVTHRVLFTRPSPDREFPLHSNAPTRLGCKCKPSWSHPTCDNGTVYYGCGMHEPCAGSEGGLGVDADQIPEWGTLANAGGYGSAAPEWSWCDVEPGCAAAQGVSGSYDGWDYCRPNHGDVFSYGLYLYSGTRELKESLMNYTLKELGVNDTSGDLTSNGFDVVDLEVETGDWYVIKALNPDGKAHPDDHAWIKVNDYAFPLAVASSIYVTNDTNYLLHNVTHTVSFVRDTAEMEDRGSHATTVGYGLRLVTPDGTVKQEIMFKTLEELGGAPGERVTYGFQVENQLIEELSTPSNDQYDSYQIFSHSWDTRFFNRPECAYYQEPFTSQCTQVYACTGPVHGQGCTDHGQRAESATGSALHSTIDEAIPLVTVDNLTTTYDTNLLLNQVTHEVVFDRPAGDVAGYATDVMGYRLYLSHSDGTQTYIMERTIAEVGGAPGQPVDTGFLVYNLTIRAEDYYKVVAYSRDGECLDFETVFVDENAIPVAIPRGISSTIDENLLINQLNLTVGITRAHAAYESFAEPERHLANVHGYRLFLTQDIEHCRALQDTITSDDCTLIHETPLSDLGPVEDRVYTTNVYRDATLPIIEYDYAFNTHYDMDYVAATTHYDSVIQLYEHQTHTHNAIVAAFSLEAELIELHDFFVVMSYNQDGNCADGVAMRIPDRATPIAVATNIRQSPDMLSGVGNAVTLNVSFDRPPASHEFPGTHEDLLGYELWLAHANGTSQFRMRKTIEELDPQGSSGGRTFPGFVLDAFLFGVGDAFVIYSYNRFGPSTLPSALAKVSGLSTPVAVVTDVSPTLDLNPIANNLTLDVVFTRPSAFMEQRGGALDAVVGYELYVYDTVAQVWKLLQHLTLAQIEATGGGNSFVLENVPVTTGAEFQIFSWNHNGSSVEGSEPVYVEDRAVPIHAVTNVYQSEDTQWNPYEVTHRVEFTRIPSENDGEESDVVGYRLYVCNPGGYRTRFAATDDLVACRLIMDHSLEFFDDQGESYFEVVTDLVDYDDYQIRAYNQYGDSFVVATHRIEDLAAPLGWYRTINGTIEVSLVDNCSLTAESVASATRVALEAVVVDPNDATSRNVTCTETAVSGGGCTVSVAIELRAMASLTDDELAAEIILLEESVVSEEVQLALQTIIDDDGASLDWKVQPELHANDYHATSMTQTLDADLDYDDVTMEVSFVRAKYEGVNAQQVAGYLLYAGEDDQRTVLLGNKTVEELGGAPGARVENPYLLQNASLATNRYYYVVAFTKSNFLQHRPMIQTYFGNHFVVPIEDKAVPLAVAENVKATVDVNMEDGYVTMDIFFDRPAVEVDHRDFPQALTGYKLYLATDAVSGEYTRGELLLTKPAEAFGGMPGGAVEYPFEPRSVQIHTPKMGAFVIVSYNDIGDCRRGAAFEIEDLTPPPVVVTNVAFTEDLDRRWGFVSQNITFHRAVDESLVEGYKIYLCERHTRVQLVGQKTLAEVGGGPGSLILNGFELDGLDVRGLDRSLAIVAYNNASDSTRTVFAGLSDFGVADLAPVECSFYDEDPADGLIGGTLNITHPEDNVMTGNATSYSVYLGSGGDDSGAKVGDVLLTYSKRSGEGSFTIPHGTSILADGDSSIDHVLIFGRNDDGHSVQGTTCQFVDFTASVPVNHAASVELLRDEDPTGGVIAGRVVIERAANERDIEHYAVYMGAGGNDTSSKLALLGRVPKGNPDPLYLDVAAVSTTEATRVIVFTANRDGESEQGTEGLFIDDRGSGPPLMPPQEVDFLLDTSDVGGRISGLVTVWKAADETDIEGYRFYLGHWDRYAGAFAASTVDPVITFDRVTNNVSFFTRDLPPTDIYEETHVLVYTFNAYGQNNEPAAAAFADTTGVNINLGSSARLDIVDARSRVALDVQAGPPWPAHCRQAYQERYISMMGDESDGEYSIASPTGNTTNPDAHYCIMEQAYGGWQLVGNVPGRGGWLTSRTGGSGGSGLEDRSVFDSSVGYNVDAFDGTTWNHDEAYLVPFDRFDFSEIMFMTGDGNVHCAVPLADLWGIGETGAGRAKVISSYGVSIREGDVSTGVAGLDEQGNFNFFFGCEGAEVNNQHQMLWGEAAQGRASSSTQYVEFKNAHGGVGVFVR